MASTLKNVAIIGASGSIGKLILEGFINASHLKVTALLRASSTATFAPGINVKKFGTTEDELVDALKGQDVVISVVGLGGFTEQIKLVDAAIKAGVKRFMPSEFSSNTLSPAVRKLLPVFDQKLEVLEYLRSKESSTFSWTAIWTAPLLDWGLNNGFLEFDNAEKTATIWDDGNTKFTMTNIDQLQRGVVSVLEHADQTANKNIYIASAETSQNEILAALEKASGAKYTVTKTTTEAQVGPASELLSKGDFSGAYTLVRATSFANIPDLRSNYVKDEEFSNDLLGLKLEPIEVTAARVIAGSR